MGVIDAGSIGSTGAGSIGRPPGHARDATLNLEGGSAVATLGMAGRGHGHAFGDKAGGATGCDEDVARVRGRAAYASPSSTGAMTFSSRSM
jgi:hypothetical protein